MAWSLTNNGHGGASTADPVSAGTFANALTPGSLIVVASYVSTNHTPITPTDTAGNAYVECGAGSCANGNARARLFYALNTHNTASNIISLANPSGWSLRVAAAEFAGNDSGSYGQSVVDGSAVTNNGNVGTGGGDNMVCGPITPTNNGDLIVGWALDLSGAQSVGTGFTTTGITTLEYLVQASIAAISALWHDSSNSSTYPAVMAAFRPLNTSVVLNPFVF